MSKNQKLWLAVLAAATLSSITVLWLRLYDVVSPNFVAGWMLSGVGLAVAGLLAASIIMDGS
jgi:hypothetical protein